MEWPLKRRKIVSGASFVTILSRVIALKLQVQAEAELALRRDRARARQWVVTTYTSVPLPAQPGMLILLYLSASSGIKIGPGCILWISALIGDHHGYKDRVPRTGNQSLGGASRPLRPGC